MVAISPGLKRAIFGIMAARLKSRSPTEKLRVGLCWQPSTAGLAMIGSTGLWLSPRSVKREERRSIRVESCATAQKEIADFLVADHTGQFAKSKERQEGAEDNEAPGQQLV